MSDLFNGWPEDGEPMSDLTKWLRTYWSDDYNGPPMTSDELGRRAAKALEAMQKELTETRKWRQQTAEFCDRARDERDHYRDKYHEAQARVAQLESALESYAQGYPFPDKAIEALKEQDDETT